MPPDHKSNSDAQSLFREPIYHQLHELLRALVVGGEFAPGGQFLTERQVSERFKVSRVTANKALSQLVMAGVLEFRKGVGTFVRAEALQNDLRSLVSFTKKAALSGKKPVTRVLKFCETTAAEAGPSVTEALKVSADAALYYFERLRLANGEPVILERRFLVASQCPGLVPADLEGSLYTLLESRYGLELTGAEQTIRSLNLTDADAKLLRVKSGSAALWVHGVGWAGEPLWLEDTLYRGDRYEFQNQMGGDRFLRSASLSLAARPEFVAFAQ